MSENEGGWRLRQAGPADTAEPADAPKPPEPARPLPKRRPGESPHRVGPPPRPVPPPLPDLPDPPADPAGPAPDPASATPPAPPPAEAAAGLPTRTRTAGRPGAGGRHIALGRDGSLARLAAMIAAPPGDVAAPPASLAREPATEPIPRLPSPARPRPPGAAARSAPAGPASRAAAIRSAGARGGAASPVGTRPPALAPAGSRRGRRLPVIAAGVVVLLAVVLGAVFLTGHRAAGPASDGAGPAPQAFAAAARSRAAAARWVTGQVGRSAVIACDPQFCAALHADGVPAASLLVLNAAAPDPLGASLVIATAAVRSQFSARLATVYAPAVAARFGTGAGAIAVRIVAPAGAAAYGRALAADQQQRRAVAGQLLANPQLILSAPARAAVRAGRVDARLLITLPALAAVHPVRVLAFGGAGPGADPELPLGAADLALSPAPPGLTPAGYRSWLTGYLASQRPPFDARVTRRQDGAVLRVQFTGPPPLGLLRG